MSVRLCSWLGRRFVRIVNMFVVRTVLGTRKPPFLHSLPFSPAPPPLILSPIITINNSDGMMLTAPQSKEKEIPRRLPRRRLQRHLHQTPKVLLPQMHQSLPGHPTPQLTRRHRRCRQPTTIAQVRSLRTHQVLRMSTGTYRQGRTGA